MVQTISEVKSSHRGRLEIIADILAEKEEYPSIIIEVKSWIGSQQIRDTFGYAYLLKSWSGHKNHRVFMVCLQEFDETSKNLISACAPYLDGVYSLSDEPYFDDLVDILKEIYD